MANRRNVVLQNAYFKSSMCPAVSYLGTKETFRDDGGPCSWRRTTPSGFDQIAIGVRQDPQNTILSPVSHPASATFVPRN